MSSIFSFHSFCHFFPKLSKFWFWVFFVVPSCPPPTPEWKAGGCLCFIARLGGLVDKLLIMCRVRKVHAPSSWAADLEKEPPALGMGWRGLRRREGNNSMMRVAVLQGGTRGASKLVCPRCLGGRPLPWNGY